RVMSEFLGIAREPMFSPGKVEADRAILDAVADRLRARGHEVRLLGGEKPLPLPGPRTTVFAMCQGEAALATLRAWEAGGTSVINRVDWILDCHRHRQVERLRCTEVRAPESIVLPATVADRVAWPAWLEAKGAWVKRGDVHAVESTDVVFVRGSAEASDVL